ncbi:DUF433 domain-containing protein [Streptosporangium sp. NPDC006013]|uniref:DUF433 domain-containing protein n=1 Tax=Streptosporangium sp. NPDC006013 TaxID=3155596 RepID=UPI0033AAE337
MGFDVARVVLRQARPVVDPHRAFGQPIFVETRTRVSEVAAMMKAGEEPEVIADERLLPLVGQRGRPGAPSLPATPERVHDLSPRMLVQVTVPVRSGKQRLDQRPLLIGQIRGTKTGLLYPSGKTAPRSPLEHMLISVDHR